MVSPLSKTHIVFAAALALTACASSIPSNFEYKTSVRGERGLEGAHGRIKASESLLGAGVASDPALTLSAALPNAEVKVRAWGLRYFGSNWERYQVIMDADIRRGDAKVKCREVSTETPVNAPTLAELTANDGMELQAQLDALVMACLAKAQ